MIRSIRHIKLLTVFWLAFSLFQSFNLKAQSTNYTFEVTARENSDHFLYYSINKLDKFKTIFTTCFEINSTDPTLLHRRGNNLTTKKPWKDLSFKLEEDELNALLAYAELHKLPENERKYYKSLRNRPIITLYFKSPDSEIFIQWEGSKPPKKKVIFKLLKLKSQLAALVEQKLAMQ